jgi:hypothetical protein
MKKRIHTGVRCFIMFVYPLIKGGQIAVGSKRNILSKLRIAIFVMLSSVSTIYGQSIFTNPITGTDPGQISPYTTGQIKDGNITVSGISRGSGITGNAGNNRYNTKGYNSLPFVDANDYFEFTLTPNAGYKIDFVSFTYTPQKSTTGPTLAAFRSSLTGYVTNIGAPSTINATTISLAAAAYQGRTAATTFRLYGYLALSSSGTFSINDFTFNGVVSATCSSVPITSVTPTTGPIGTEVTINAASGLTGATAAFGGVAATTVSNTATQLVVTIPSGAASGNLVVTNASACSSTPIVYTVIKEDKSSCEGTTLPTDLFISEVTDSNYGSLTYVEIYNGTASSISLAGYTLQIAFNGAAFAVGNIIALDPTVTLTAGRTYVVAIGTGAPACGTTGGDGSLADQTSTVNGINFGSATDDHVALFKPTASFPFQTKIDSWGTFGNSNWATPWTTWNTEGVTFKRKNNATPLPITTFVLSDWDVIDYAGTTVTSCSNNDYSDIGVYTVSKIPPTVNTQPTATIGSCTTTSLSLSVSATEGVAAGNGLAYQWYVAVPGGSGWTAVTNTGVYTNATTSSLSISNFSGLNNYQYYCQVRENTGTCFSASNVVVVKDIYTTTWNGPVLLWSNGVPSATKAVVLNADYSTSTLPDIDACSLKINSGVTVTITGGHYFNIVNNIANSGTLNIQNNGSLVQVNDASINTGNISMERDASIKKLDYVYWSSPLKNFPVNNILTGMPTSFIFKWEARLANPNGGEGFWKTAAGDTMDPGKGYIARGPTSLDPYSVTTVTAAFSSGEPNNGIVAQTIYRGSMTAATLATYTSANGIAFTVNDDDYNLLGNPYPSAISAADFLTYNMTAPNDVIEGSVRLWRHGISPAAIANPFYNSYLYNYDINDYITYNGTASVPAGFNGYIAAGQAFFVLMHEGDFGNATVTFNNAMRVNGNAPTNNSQFYKTAHTKGVNGTERHRIWLDMIGPTGRVERTVVGYVPDATIQKDNLFDAYTLGQSNEDFYSLINGERMIIQGRPVPFEINDRVKLGLKAPVQGNYTIAIAEVDGLFSNARKAIYLEDTAMNIIHDLRQAPYTFSIGSGTFDNRFVLRYTNGTLSTQNFLTSDDKIVIASNQEELKIKSYQESIKNVTVYDVLGRTVYDSKTIDTTEFAVAGLALNHQALIVKILLDNDQTVTRKIVH